jgi:hypothetical protein
VKYFIARTGLSILRSDGTLREIQGDAGAHDGLGELVGLAARGEQRVGLFPEPIRDGAIRGGGQFGRGFVHISSSWRAY